ncbi:MAG: hypothetical protein R3266_15945 [Gemmatimonadota bacterium]|nr:hypothetical protein [Gemmatimonadota bacterium]
MLVRRLTPHLAFAALILLPLTAGCDHLDSGPFFPEATDAPPEIPAEAGRDSIAGLKPE